MLDHLARAFLKFLIKNELRDGTLPDPHCAGWLFCFQSENQPRIGSTAVQIRLSA